MSNATPFPRHLIVAGAVVCGVLLALAFHMIGQRFGLDLAALWRDPTVIPAGAPTGAWETINTVPDPLVAGSTLTLLQDDGNAVWYNDGNTSKSGLSDDEMKDLGDTFTYEP